MRKKRYGFSIIELIMTIVVIGIAFIGIPLIMSSLSTSASWMANSKGIYHGVSKVQIIRSKFWDEANQQDYDDYGIFYVVGINESSSANGLLNGLLCENDQNRSGHYIGDGRRKCTDRTASTIGQDGGDFDDIDDYNTDSDPIEQFVLNTTIEYITYDGALDADGLNTDNNMSFFTDGDTNPNLGDTANIKKITIKMTKGSQNIGSYRYYATNIGTPKPAIKHNTP